MQNCKHRISFRCKKNDDRKCNVELSSYKIVHNFLELLYLHLVCTALESKLSWHNLHFSDGLKYSSNNKIRVGTSIESHRILKQPAELPINLKELREPHTNLYNI